MKDRKEKKKWGLIIIMVFIIIGTSFSIFSGFQPQKEAVKYNGIKFVRSNNAWLAKINGRDAAFSFPPTEVASIGMQQDIASRLQDKFEIDTTSYLNSTYKE